MRLAPLFLLVCFCGCTHTQLRWNTVKQSQSLTEIYEQQVLDNLAMFSDNPHSIPHLAIPTSGGSDVTDKGSFSGTPFNEFRRIAGFNADRTMKEAWTLEPITDPDKLRRMRCAFQRAVGCADENCVKCCDLRKAFLGKSDTKIPLFDDNGDIALNPGTGTIFDGTAQLVLKQPVDPKTMQDLEGPPVYVYEPMVTDIEKLTWGYSLRPRRVHSMDGEPLNDKAGKPLYVHIREETYGRISEVRFPVFDCNSECEVHPCWFHVNKNGRHQKHWKTHVGRYRGTTVWVPPSGRDELGRLVLEILDYALKDPAVKPVILKEVTVYLDANGEPSNEQNAYQVVKTQIPINEKNVAVESGKIAKPEVAKTDAILSWLSETAGMSDPKDESLLNKKRSEILERAEQADRAAERVLENAPVYQFRQQPTLNLRELELNRRFILGSD